VNCIKPSVFIREMKSSLCGRKIVFVQINKNHVLWHHHYLVGRSPSSTRGRHGFNKRPVCVGSVSDGVELGKTFLENFFHCQ
jgi:hypothetical protein